jgi:predicted acetyltransferase
VNIVLRRLTLADEKAFLEGLKLFSDMDSDWYTFVWEVGMSYQTMWTILEDEFHGRNLREGWVPASHLYAFLGNVIVGRSSIRHELSEFLLNKGGNIGYAVAMTYRGKGVATEMLKQSLQYCKNIVKLDKVLVTCDDDNEASFKTIEKNGGVLENRFVSQDGSEITRRYWIKL